jgi:hypothetical protein
MLYLITIMMVKWIFFNQVVAAKPMHVCLETIPVEIIILVLAFVLVMVKQIRWERACMLSLAQILCIKPIRVKPITATKLML